MSYKDYLGGAHWAGVKARYRASDLPQDCICGETEGLHLHHMTYERLGREELTDLAPLCPPCHAMIHVLVNRGELGLDFSGFVSEQRAAKYAEVIALRQRVIAEEIASLYDEMGLTRLERALVRLLAEMDALSDDWQRGMKRDLRMVRSRTHALQRGIECRKQMGRERSVAF